MLSLKKCRNILGSKSKEYSDTELSDLRDSLYSLANVDYSELKEFWKTQRAVVYYQESSNSQEEITEESILEKFKEFLILQRIHITESFSELDISDQENDKPEFDKLLGYVSLNSTQIDCLILLNMNKLKLSPLELSLLFERLKVLRISLIAANESEDLIFPDDEGLLKYFLNPIPI